MAIEEEHNLFGNWWKNIDTTKKNAIVKEITRQTALPVIEKYEWLGTLPVNYKKFAGIYFNTALAGVVCFVDVKFGGKFTLFNYPAICLGRGACVHWCPDYGGSFLIQKSIKLLFGKEEPKYLVAFTDSKAGEIGTIYQACGWVYLGSKKTKEWIDSNGKRYDINTPSVRAVSGFARKNNKDLKATKEQRQKQIEKMLNEGYKLAEGPIRGKYATVIGSKNKIYRQMLKKILKKSKPYPKRTDAVEVAREIHTKTIGEGKGQFLDTAQ